MKRNKFTGNLLFGLAVFSPMLSFAITCWVGEVKVFGIAGAVRYSWMIWFFVPIAVLSFVVGRKLKRASQKYRKNYIAAFISLPVLLIFGSYRFVYKTITYDEQEFYSVEKIVGFEMPDAIKIVTEQTETGKISYVKFLDKSEHIAFQDAVEISALWNKQLATSIKGFLPLNIQWELNSFDFFMFYNRSSDEYNKCPLRNKDDCILIAYDIELNRLMIFSEFEVIIT